MYFNFQPEYYLALDNGPEFNPDFYIGLNVGTDMCRLRKDGFCLPGSQPSTATAKHLGASILCPRSLHLRCSNLPV